jgi:hypothetical protein
MKSIVFAVSLALPGLLAGGVARAEEARSLPVDQETTLNGVEVACTGVGDDAHFDPRWPTYPVRIEFADSRAEYLAGLDIEIASARGVTILRAHCDSPWFLAKLRPGKYKVSATFEGRVTRTAKFTAPRRGQSRTIVRFPDVGAGE